MCNLVVMQSTETMPNAGKDRSYLGERSTLAGIHKC